VHTEEQNPFDDKSDHKEEDEKIDEKESNPFDD